MTKRIADEHRRILKTLDLAAARKIWKDEWGPPGEGDLTVLAGMHKARLKIGRPVFTRAELAESEEFLRENGYRVPGEDAPTRSDDVKVRRQ